MSASPISALPILSSIDFTTESGREPSVQEDSDVLYVSETVDASRSARDPTEEEKHRVLDCNDSNSGQLHMGCRPSAYPRFRVSTLPPILEGWS